jgi:hypothetical protein
MASSKLVFPEPFGPVKAFASGKNVKEDSV